MYRCWVHRIVDRLDKRRGFSHENDCIEKRCVVGYSSKVHESVFSGDYVRYEYYVHYVGGEGIAREFINESQEIDLLLLRRPVAGVFIILGLLSIALTYAACKWVYEVFRYDIPNFLFG